MKYQKSYLNFKGISKLNTAGSQQLLNLICLLLKEKKKKKSKQMEVAYSQFLFVYVCK